MTGGGVAAIVVAAGKGLRMGGTDKQFARLGDAPVLVWSLRAFQGCDQVDRIVVVTRQDQIVSVQSLAADYGLSKVTSVCRGGERRQDSVRNGVEQVRDARWVVVHDGARPLVTSKMIADGLAAASDTGAAIAAVPIKDTVKRVGSDSLIAATLNRSELWTAQTPQVFGTSLLSDVYANERLMASEMTDESALIEAAGHSVRVFMGSYENLKITTPVDLIVAESLLACRETVS